MSRIATAEPRGGGISVGYGHARIQADLLRQMVDVLRTIADGGNSPRPRPPEPFP